jgi:hypothetical protein
MATTTVKLNSNDYDGATAELYDASAPPMPFLPVAIPIAAVKVANAQMTFPVAAPAAWAIRVRDGDTLLRSGVRGQSVGQLDGSDFTANFLALRITDQDQTTLSFADLQDEIELPIVEDELTITSLSLSATGGHVRATGAGTYQAAIVGAVPIAYTYDFALNPVTAPLSTRLMDVTTEDVSVVGTAGGISGWMLNLVVGLVTFLFQGRIADELRSAVQARVDEAVGAQLSGSQVPAGTSAHLRTISVSSSGVKVDPHVLVPMSTFTCPIAFVAGPTAVGATGQLPALRAMRDQVLARHVRGQAYVALLERHGPELVRLLADDAELRRAADQVIAAGLRDFDPRAPARGTLRPETADAATRLMEAAARRASPTLRTVLRSTIGEVREFVGRPVESVLADSTRQLERQRGR